MFRTATIRRARSRRSPGLEPLEPRELLATIPVTTLADAGDGSLRAAIERANLDPGPDAITFTPDLTGAITLATALPELTSAITLTGPGAALLSITRGSGLDTPEFRILTIAAGADVSLSGVTLSGGRVRTTGAGLLNAGTLRLDQVVVTANTVRVPLFEQGPGGGGISNTGSLTIQRSQIQDNLVVADGSGPTGGGGILNTGELTIEESRIARNQAFSWGGGIRNSGTLRLVRSTLEANGAGAVQGAFNFGSDGSGGGISNSGTLTIVESTLGRNSARPGAFIGRWGASYGGGIDNRGLVVIERSTLSDNHAGGRDGGGGTGLFNWGTAQIVNSTISALSESPAFFGLINSVGQLVITGSTVAANVGDVFASSLLRISGPGPLDQDRSTIQNSILLNSFAEGRTLVADPVAFQSLGHNLFSDQPTLPLDPTDRTQVDPRLGPLADNGGPTWTLALLPGSPALNAGAFDPALATDQRGVARPQGNRPDIGAFEAILAAPRLTRLERRGIHRQPTRLVLQFDDTMDRVRATNLANYTLEQLGPGGRGRPIALQSASLLESAREVSLSPSRRLALRGRYRLTVRGQAPDGLTSRDGMYLDGQGTGQPGTDLVRTFGREVAVLPPRTQLAVPGRMRR